ncbi:MAG: hypothetical protein GX245_00925 [Eubacteriaceae bacterium]|jgi:hypothetical protein|nr:hypothetical protein [Eubacteriaceae bacterium]
MKSQIKGVGDIKKLKRDKSYTGSKADEYTNPLKSLWVLAGALAGFLALRKNKTNNK